VLPQNSFRPGAGFPGQQGAADRAYQQELARTAQLTAQDPELQRYERPESAAKTQEEMNSVRDMGLAMWAKANPKLAAKVQPGQTGYQEAYDLLGTQTLGTGQPVSPTANFEQSTEKAERTNPGTPHRFGPG
jgi:hypothetical protein